MKKTDALSPRRSGWNLFPLSIEANAGESVHIIIEEGGGKLVQSLLIYAAWHGLLGAAAARVIFYLPLHHQVFPCFLPLTPFTGRQGERKLQTLRRGWHDLTQWRRDEKPKWEHMVSFVRILFTRPSWRHAMYVQYKSWPLLISE